MQKRTILQGANFRFLAFWISSVLLSFLIYSFTTDSKWSAEYQKPKPTPKVELAICHGHCNLLADAYMSDVVMGWNKADKTDITIDFKVNMASVATFSEEVGEYLKSEAVFNTDAHQFIEFECIDNFKLGENWYQLRGNLTINGVTKDVSLMMNSSKHYLKSTGKTDDKYVISGDVNLFDYGIEYIKEDGSLPLFKKGEMYFNVELLKGHDC